MFTLQFKTAGVRPSNFFDALDLFTPLDCSLTMMSNELSIEIREIPQLFLALFMFTQEKHVKWLIDFIEFNYRNRAGNYEFNKSSH